MYAFDRKFYEDNIFGILKIFDETIKILPKTLKVMIKIDISTKKNKILSTFICYLNSMVYTFVC